MCDVFLKLESGAQRASLLLIVVGLIAVRGAWIAVSRQLGMDGLHRGFGRSGSGLQRRTRQNAEDGAALVRDSRLAASLALAVALATLVAIDVAFIRSAAATAGATMKTSTSRNTTLEDIRLGVRPAENNGAGQRRSGRKPKRGDRKQDERRREATRYQ